jgi:hypothetical protein
MLVSPIIRSFAFLVFVLALTSCGGGGGVDAGSSGGGGGDTYASVKGRLSAAMAGGDSSMLKPEDAGPVISVTYANYQSLLDTQNNFISRFYSGLSTKFELIKHSYMIQPAFQNKETVFPLVVGDKGYVLASLSTVGGGRIAGYGYDILAGFDLTKNRIVGLSSTNTSVETFARQTDHQPVFKRVLAWLVYGDPARELPKPGSSGLNIAWSSLPTSSSNQLMYTTTDTQQKVYKPFAVEGLAALNVAFNNLSCDPLSAPVKDCAAKANLVVIGGINKNNNKDVLSVQLDRIKEMVNARIPILYLNTHASGGAPNDFASGSDDQDFPRLQAMGFANGALPDKSNYYWLDWVANEVTPDQRKKSSDFLNAGFLRRLSESDFNTNYDWSTCVEDSTCTKPQAFIDDIITPLEKIKSQLDDINRKGQNLFDPQVGYQSLQQLVLWADAYRKNITYPINKLTQPVEFQKAYIADSLNAYVRSSGTAQKDLGNFLAPDVGQVSGSTQTENVTVTLPGSNGFTSVGRFVLPGQALTIQLQNAPAAGTIKFFINTAGEANTKLFTSPVDNNGKQAFHTGYRRPRLPQSPDFPLSTKPITIVSPYGGLLELRFWGAKNVPSVVLQIKGAAKQPFYDTTQGTADANAFLNEIQTSKLGWLEIKTPGIEIHSLISKTKEFMLPDPKQAQTTVYPNYSKPYYNSSSKTIDMSKYLAETQKYVMEDAYRLAGYQVGNLKLNERVKNFCTSHGWNCDSSAIHEPPVLQHYHTDYAANCGWMCSGNPITSGGGFEPRGWGESHELGHNLQKFNVYNSASGEVSNNIYPLHKKWRLLIELNRSNVGYLNELPDSAIVFDSLKDTFKSSLNAEQKIAKAKNDIWMDSNSKSHLNRGMLYFYLQWPLIYAEVIQSKNPDMTEVEAIEAGWDVFTLMNLNRREVEASKNWATDKAKLGFSAYAQKPATSTDVVSNGVFIHHDYLLTVLSLITGRDQRPLFDFWGVETTSAGRNQVEAMGLSSQPVKFYAVRCSDDFRGFQAVDMTSANPVFPWPDEFKNLIDVTPVSPATTLSSAQNNSISTKQNRHNAACLAMPPLR